jgi:nicotinate-nucleotide--dimethylbenzimidazole phosphoribosyltransferase
MLRMVLTGLEHLEIKPLSPMAPDDSKGQVLARVLSCAICRTDAKMWEQGHRDLIFPRVLGHEMVVRIQYPDQEVDQDQQAYIVWPGKSCGQCKYCKSHRENLCEKMEITGFHTDGGFAHQVILPQKSLIPLPKGLDIHVACFAEPIGCVINAFEKLTFKRGDRVLIYGAGTMGLVTALYAKSLGLVPLIIEKHENKIRRTSAFLKYTAIPCVKETLENEFDIVINACPDPIALCQAITKVDKGGAISFFSGITKNEHVETNLLNLIHYKEASLTGAYGMKKSDMAQAIPFMQAHEKQLQFLIQEVVSPEQAPLLLPRVLTGQTLKFILDFTGRSPEKMGSGKMEPRKMGSEETEAPQSFPGEPHPDLPAMDFTKTFAEQSFGGQVIQAISPVSHELLPDARAKMDDKTKPLGALGTIETLGIQMSQIQNSLSPVILQKNLFVFAGDHGITEEGVSAFPSEVTGQMVENFLNGGAAINVLCRHHNIDMKVVDMGVIKEFSPHPDLIIAKVARGTRNFAIEAAMTRDQMQKALETGMQIFLSAHAIRPIQIVGLGEMGIGNTTSASAIICVITGISPAQATGRGTGVDNKGLEHKTKVIERVLAFHRPNPANGFEILEKIGGFEIAGIAGAILGAASKGCAVVLDGVISTAAGLVAHTINPLIQGYLISGHKSVEQAQKAALTHMELAPVIDFNMRLGEGTGAALAMDTIDVACKIMTQMASFNEAKISRKAVPNHPLN